MPRRHLVKPRAVVLVVCAAVVLIAIAYLVYREWHGGRGITLETNDPKILVVGEQVYRSRCASCHGANLEGQPNWRSRGPDGLLPAPPHDESGHTWHHPDEVLFRLTRDGMSSIVKMKNYTSAMPAFAGELTDEEIVAVLSWIRSQWPPTVRDRQQQINRQYVESKD